MTAIFTALCLILSCTFCAAQMTTQQARELLKTVSTEKQQAANTLLQQLTTATPESLVSPQIEQQITVLTAPTRSVINDIKNDSLFKDAGPVLIKIGLVIVGIVVVRNLLRNFNLSNFLFGTDITPQLENARDAQRRTEGELQQIQQKLQDLEARADQGKTMIETLGTKVTEVCTECTKQMAQRLQESLDLKTVIDTIQQQFVDYGNHLHRIDETQCAILAVKTDLNKKIEAAKQLAQKRRASITAPAASADQPVAISPRPVSPHRVKCVGCKPS